MLISIQFFVDETDIIFESRLCLMESADASESDLKVVIGAVEGKDVAGILAYCFVTDPVVVKFLRRKAKVFDRLLHGGDTDGFFGFLSGQVDDRHFDLDSDIVRAGFLQRRDKTIKDQFVCCFHILSPYVFLTVPNKPYKAACSCRR